MTSLDLGNLTPEDAIAALRSYPRRYSAVLREPTEQGDPELDDVQVDERASRAGPDGASALAVVAGLQRAWSTLGEALRQVVVSDDPVLDPAVAEVGADWSRAQPAASAAEAVTALEARATTLAGEIERIPGDSWSRTGSVAGGGGSVTALGLVQTAVRVGREGLDHVQRTLAAVDR